MEVVAGGMSAAAACVFTNPMEVVKNRLQGIVGVGVGVDLHISY